MASYYIDKTNRTARPYQNSNGKPYATWAVNNGPFESGGALYAVGRADLSSLPIYVYKSVDSGATWTAMNTGSAPFARHNAVTVCQQVGTLLYILYFNYNVGTASDTGLRIATFDMATDTWSAFTVDMPATDAVDPSCNFTFMATAVGTFNVVFNGYGPPFSLWKQRYTAGAWAVSPTAITDGAVVAPILTGFARDLVTGALHFFYSGISGSSPNVVKHRTVSSAGVVGAADVAIADAIIPTFGGASAGPAFGEGQVVGSKVIMPWTDPSSVQGAPSVLTYTGSAWVNTTITIDELYRTRVRPAAVTQSALDGSTVYIGWCSLYVDDDGNEIVVVRMVTTTDGVTMTAINDLMDFGANLPTQPPTWNLQNFNIVNPSLKVLGTGDVAVIFEGQPNGGDAYSFYYSGSLAPPVPPALAVTCDNPPNGVVGVAYTHTFPATGGVEPYAFAISAGALPDGVTLAAATGIASGTPTLAGTFPFTVQVTDADLTVVTVNCSITITQIIPPPPESAGDVITHYFEEVPEGEEPRLMMGTKNGFVVAFDDSNEDNGEDLRGTIRTPSYDMDDPRSLKLFMDQMTDANAVGGYECTIGFNNHSITAATPTVPITAGRRQYLVSVSSEDIAGLKLYRNIDAEYLMGWGTVLYEYEPSLYVQPFYSNFYTTQLMDFQIPGWKQLRYGRFAVISNDDVQLQILNDDGTVLADFAIPDTNGILVNYFVQLPHAAKGRLLRFTALSDSEFVLFTDKTFVRIKKWGGPQFQEVQPFLA